MPLLGLIAAIVAAVVAAILAAGTRAKARLREANPPSGRLVDIGGYRLHIDCRGDGTPAIVLMPGTGDISVSWLTVRDAVAGFTRACVYDRAGMAWSDRSPRPATLEVMADELGALLRASEIGPPYVLVGHSFGALVARYFAHRHHPEVTGLVLVDPAHEDQFRRAPAAVQSMQRRMSRMVGAMYAIPRVLAGTGIMALRPSMAPASFPPAAKGLDIDRYRAVTAMDGGSFAAVTAEMKHLEESQEQMRASRQDLGDLPLLVLTHGKATPIPGISADAQDENERLWRELHEELARLSSGGRVIMAEESTHAIHVEQRDLVVDAIREVWEAARSAGSA